MNQSKKQKESKMLKIDDEYTIKLIKHEMSVRNVGTLAGMARILIHEAFWKNEFMRNNGVAQESEDV